MAFLEVSYSRLRQLKPGFENILSDQDWIGLVNTVACDPLSQNYMDRDVSRSGTQVRLCLSQGKSR